MNEKAREEKRKLAKASLKRILNNIVTCWEEERGCLLENSPKRRKKLKKKLFTLSNALKTEVDKNEKLLARDLVDEARDIANGFIKLSIEIR